MKGGLEWPKQRARVGIVEAKKTRQTGRLNDGEGKWARDALGMEINLLKLGESANYF